MASRHVSAGAQPPCGEQGAAADGPGSPLWSEEECSKTSATKAAPPCVYTEHTSVFSLGEPHSVG